jgi:DNA-binding response OmpR family regulator
VNLPMSSTLGSYHRLILVVEDEPSIGEVLEAIFQLEGYAVRLARCAHEAMRAATIEHPDLITLDLNLPDGSGQDVLRYLARHDDLSCTPVVVLSAYTVDLRPTPQVARILQKPFDVDELLAVARRALTTRAA